MLLLGRPEQRAVGHHIVYLFAYHSVSLPSPPTLQFPILAGDGN